MTYATTVADTASPVLSTPRPTILVDRSGKYVPLNGSSNLTIAAGVATDTVVKGSGGTLVKILVVTTGTNALLVYDNNSTHSGTIIGAVPANAAVGSVYSFGFPASVGITVQGNAANPGVTVNFD
jgi:hypothetical protein